MSEQPAGTATSILEEMARAQRAKPVVDIEELRAELWPSEAEFQEFLTDWRVSRDASMS